MVFSYDLIFDSLSFLVSAGILQLVSILVAIIAFFYQHHKDNFNKKKEFRDRLNRISKLILRDLEIIESRRSGNAEIQIVKTSEGEYIEDHLSTEHYQSIVYSGLITYFQRETQSEVTHFYHLITLHNKRIFDIGNMINSRLYSARLGQHDRDDLEGSIAWKLNQNQLARYEKEIEEKLPTVRKLLKNELQRLE